MLKGFQKHHIKRILAGAVCLSLVLGLSGCGKDSFRDSYYSNLTKKYSNKFIDLQWKKPKDLEVTVLDQNDLSAPVGEYPQLTIQDNHAYSISLSIYDITSSGFPDDFVKQKSKTEITAADLVNQLALNALKQDERMLSLMKAEISEPETRKIGGKKYAAQKVQLTRCSRDGDEIVSCVLLARKVDNLFSVVNITYKGNDAELAIEKAMSGFKKA